MKKRKAEINWKKMEKERTLNFSEETRKKEKNGEKKDRRRRNI